MSIEDDWNPFGPGVDYAVPPGPYGGGVIYVTETGALDPSVTITDQAGNIIYAPLTPAEWADLFPEPQPDPPFGDDNAAPPEPDPEPEPYPSTGQPNPLVPNTGAGPPDVPAFGPGPPVLFDPGPPDAGGPEERPPPIDFDQPPRIAPPPPSQPPSTVPDWELMRPGPGPIRLPKKPPIWVFDDEGYGDVPWGKIPLPRMPLPRVPGPVGVILDTILRPERLGSGTLPFPPIPQVSIPEPVVTLPPLQSWPDEPPAPEIVAPPVPDVMVVTPEDQWPSSVPSPSPAPIATPSLASPSPVLGPRMWSALLSAIIVGRAKRSRARSSFAQPASSVQTFTDPLTPPRIRIGEPNPFLDTPPLTAVNTGALPSGPPSMLPPQQLTQEDQCNCRNGKKDRKKPRKCATRAPLVWAGGPKKGQAAGTRCIEFKDLV